MNESQLAQLKLLKSRVKARQIMYGPSVPGTPVALSPLNAHITPAYTPSLNSSFASTCSLSQSFLSASTSAKAVVAGGKEDDKTALPLVPPSLLEDSLSSSSSSSVLSDPSETSRSYSSKHLKPMHVAPLVATPAKKRSSGHGGNHGGHHGQSTIHNAADSSSDGFVPSLDQLLETEGTKHIEGKESSVLGSKGVPLEGGGAVGPLGGGAGSSSSGRNGRRNKAGSKKVPKSSGSAIDYEHNTNTGSGQGSISSSKPTQSSLTVASRVLRSHNKLLTERRQVGIHDIKGLRSKNKKQIGGSRLFLQGGNENEENESTPVPTGDSSKGSGAAKDESTSISGSGMLPEAIQFVDQES